MGCKYVLKYIYSCTYLFLQVAIAEMMKWFLRNCAVFNTSEEIVPGHCIICILRPPAYDGENIPVKLLPYLGEYYIKGHHFIKV